MSIKPCKGGTMICEDTGCELIDDICGVDGEVFRPFRALGCVRACDILNELEGMLG